MNYKSRVVASCDYPLCVVYTCDDDDDGYDDQDDDDDDYSDDDSDDDDDYMNMYRAY